MVISAAAVALPPSEAKRGGSIKNMISGGIAGAVAKTCVAPIERVKILFQVSTRQHLHIGIVGTLADIARNEGVRAYWKGNWANCSRVIPYVQHIPYCIFVTVFPDTPPCSTCLTSTRRSCCIPKATIGATSRCTPCPASVLAPSRASSASARRT